MTITPNLIRIMTDIMNFEKNKIPGIEIFVNKKNIKEIYALIIGPESTPYQNGLFFFKIDFPDDYPKKNPNVKFLTINSKIRFNPNLYENGKVCLSILGTWSGPGWSPTMTLSSVLLSIQSLLHENPIINEPGHEKYKVTEIISENYNNYLRYWTIKLGIIEVILLKNFDNYREMFNDYITSHLVKNLNNIYNDTKTFALLFEGDLLNGENIYFIKNKKHCLKFNDLIKYLEIISKKYKIKLSC